MKREVKISVAGQSLTIRTDENERYVKELADYVDGHMGELARGQKGTTTLSLAILAALNIADEYRKLRDVHEQVTQGIDSLTGDLETTLQSEAS